MAQFKEFTNVDGDPMIVNRDAVATTTIEVIRRGEKHERVDTVIILTGGGRAIVKEPFNDVREWLTNSQIS